MAMTNSPPPLRSQYLKARPTCFRLFSQVLSLARRCRRTVVGIRTQTRATVTIMTRSSMRVKAPGRGFDNGAFIPYLSVRGPRGVKLELNSKRHSTAALQDL